MSFYHRYRSPDMSVFMRRAPGGFLKGYTIQIELDLMRQTLTEEQAVIPKDARDRLGELVKNYFDGKLLIDQDDPYADDLMKLKRIKAADPVLFENGTTGPVLAFFIAHRVEDWLAAEKWNDGEFKTQIGLAAVKIGDNEYSYSIG